MSGGKGGSETTKTEIPAWIRDPAIRNLARAEAVQRIPYMPYYGPDVAAFTPAQNAAFDQNIGAAEAFGLLAPNTLTATSGMPAPTEWAGGFTGYSSQPMYEQALAELKAKQPGAVAQYDALFGGNVPTTWGNNPRFRGSAGGSPSSPPSGNDRIELGYDDRKDYVGFDDSYTGAKHGARKPGGGNPNPVPRYIAPGATQAKLDAYAQPYEGNTWEKAAAEQVRRDNLTSQFDSEDFAPLTPTVTPPVWDLSPGHPSLNVAKKKVDKMIVDDNVEKISFIEPMTIRDWGEPPNLDVRKNANPHANTKWSLGRW